MRTRHLVTLLLVGGALAGAPSWAQSPAATATNAINAARGAANAMNARNALVMQMINEAMAEGASSGFEPGGGNLGAGPRGVVDGVMRNLGVDKGQPMTASQRAQAMISVNSWFGEAGGLVDRITTNASLIKQLQAQLSSMDPGLEYTGEMNADGTPVANATNPRYTSVQGTIEKLQEANRQARGRLGNLGTMITHAQTYLGPGKGDRGTSSEGGSPLTTGSGGVGGGQGGGGMGGAGGCNAGCK